MRLPQLDRPTALVSALAIAYAVCLVASWWHLATNFGSLEHPGQWVIGAAAALTVDLGLAALALAVAYESGRGRDTGFMWGAVILFALISALANADHALTVMVGHAPTLTDVAALDTLARLRVLVFAAALPVLVVVLARVVDRIATPTKAAAMVTEEEAERRVFLARIDEAERYYLDAQDGEPELVATPAPEPVPVATSNGHEPAWLVGYLAAVATVGPSDKAVAAAMGKSVRQVRRYRTEAAGR